jgi:HlyD family secretion protein
MKRRLVTIGIVIALAAGAFFLYRTFVMGRAVDTSQYQTETARRGSLTAMVGATGIVKANQTAEIGWQTSGRIDEIAVEVRDQVNRGDRLADLAENSLPQTVILARADLVSARRNLENLQTSDVARAEAQLALRQAQDELEDAQNDRTSLNYARSSDATINSARADLILAEDSLEKAQEYYNAFADREDTDPLRAAALSQLSAAQRAYDRALANLNYLLSKPDEDEIAAADARVEVAQANLQAAQREWERLREGPDPEDVEAAEARVAAIEATLDMIELAAPFDGTVTAVYSKEGDQVVPGTVSFRMDDLSRLLVEVEIPEVDINRIQVGQPVRLSFDAFLGSEYQGSVAQVSQVGTAVQGLVNFIVTIELEDGRGEVLPGMTAAVNIVVEQLDDVLLVPNRAVRSIEGQRVVYVLREDNPMPQPVQIIIGAISDVVSEVVSGELEEGDTIVLNPTMEFQPGSAFGR